MAKLPFKKMGRTHMNGKKAHEKLLVIRKIQNKIPVKPGWAWLSR